MGYSLRYSCSTRMHIWINKYCFCTVYSFHTYCVVYWQLGFFSSFIIATKQLIRSFRLKNWGKNDYICLVSVSHSVVDLLVSRVFDIIVIYRQSKQFFPIVLQLLEYFALFWINNDIRMVANRQWISDDNLLIFSKNAQNYLIGSYFALNSIERMLIEIMFKNCLLHLMKCSCSNKIQEK